MSEESERFRLRARECRELAARANTASWRDMLNEIARDLEEEADNIERIERNQPRVPPNGSNGEPTEGNSPPAS
jgi:hypothetical protein